MLQNARVDVFTETGTRRVFAGAIEWPGWCRSGRSEDEALQALIGSAARYARAVAGAGTGPRFRPPRSVADLHVVDRLGGSATTDFGAPGAAPASDLRELDVADLARLKAILSSCWAALDRAAHAAQGRALAKGPRGGGRSLEAIIRHVTEAEASYVARLGISRPKIGTSDASAAAVGVHMVTDDALSRAVRDGLPARGPRGGAIWTPRYLARRIAWHALDHAWEIEDRAGSGP